MKKHAIKLRSAAVAAARETNYDVETQKFSTKYYSRFILCGRSADIDPVKAEIKNLIEGFTFE